MSLYPVILAVPSRLSALKGRPRTLRLSALARRAVVCSARHSELKLSHLKKNGHGAPLPNGDLHWSLSHKLTYVAGVVARHAVGIDIEQVRPISDGLFAKVADEAERNLADCADPLFFFRIWTAKEAVLKAAGVGLRDMNHCRVQTLLDNAHLRLVYQGRPWLVVHHYFDNHVAALTSPHGLVRWVHA